MNPAIERATQADNRDSEGQIWGPLHGLPVTVKEALDWVGTPSTWGVAGLATNMPERKATVVDRSWQRHRRIDSMLNYLQGLGDDVDENWLASPVVNSLTPLKRHRNHSRDRSPYRTRK